MTTTVSRSEDPMNVARAIGLPTEEIEEPPVVVVFRKWRQRTMGDGVLALFPFDIADDAGHVTSYEHIGQHGGADYQGCIAATRPATPAEYADLKTELERIGYKLIVRKRANRHTV